MITITDAIISLGITEFALRGEPTSSSEFNSMFSKITSVDSNGIAIESNDPADFGTTWEQIKTKQDELQAAYNAKAYSRSRGAEYPSIADQLDDIYHNGIDAWKATIKTTKDKYPKP